MERDRLFGKRFVAICATYLQSVKQLHMCEVPTGC